jgi:hypothetical protein
MKRAVGALLTLLLATAALSPGQTPEWADKLFAPGGVSHDFGNVPRGATLVHRFPVTNIYAVPLTFTQIRPGCGCVTATASASPLAPKETGYIEVQMDARKFSGSKSVTIQVTVGPDFVSTAALQVTANSRSDVVCNPGEVNFGIVASGQKPLQTLDVEYAGALDWRVQGIADHSLPLETAIQELYRRPGEVGYRLAVTLKPDAPPGAFKHELLLKTNDPASPTMPVLVEGNVQAALTVAGAPVKFEGGKVGAEQSKRVLVNGLKPFRIVAIEGQTYGLTAEQASAATQVHPLTIRWTPSQAGPFKTELRVKTDLDGGATVTIPVEGTAAP